jgi:hypothetical protein
MVHTAISGCDAFQQTTIEVERGADQLPGSGETARLTGEAPGGPAALIPSAALPLHSGRGAGRQNALVDSGPQPTPKRPV